MCALLAGKVYAGEVAFVNLTIINLTDDSHQKLAFKCCFPPCAPN